MKQLLAGHTSQDTAYMIKDYPYGRKLRCRRRVWLEYKPNHGYRLVSQTEHPTTKRWNNPHTSTYIEVAAAIYIDTETNHVEWTGIGIYTEAKEALEFAQLFGSKCEGSSRLVVWAERKANLSANLASGKTYITMNNVKVDRTDDQKTKDLEESNMWREVARLMTV